MCYKTANNDSKAKAKGIDDKSYISDIRRDARCDLLEE